jgi:hypothetical protein
MGAAMKHGKAPAVERRRMRRLSHVEEHRITTARVRPGLIVRLIDICAAGALIETSHRLLPGKSVELAVERGTEQDVMRGQVLRCAVVKVQPTWIYYRGAIGFDHHVPWLLDQRDHPVRAAAVRSALPDRASATQEAV